MDGDSIVEVDKEDYTIAVKRADSNDPPKMFTFDAVYDCK